MIILGAQITDDTIKGLGRTYRKAMREALLSATRKYHDEIFPRHFSPGNSSRYQIKRRTPVYLTEIKPKSGDGQGRFVDLLLKGTTRRRMMHEYRVWLTDGGSTAVLKMQTPKYFTNPFIGTYVDEKSGRQKVITQQPDKEAEVVQVNDQDKQQMAAIIQRSMLAALKTKRAKQTRKL